MKVRDNISEVAKHRRHSMNDIVVIITTIPFYELLRKTDTKSETEPIFLDYSSVIQLLYLIFHFTLRTMYRCFSKYSFNPHSIQNDKSSFWNLNYFYITPPRAPAHSTSINKTPTVCQTLI